MHVPATVQARLKGVSDLDSAGVQFPSLPPTGEHLPWLNFHNPVFPFCRTAIIYFVLSSY